MEPKTVTQAIVGLTVLVAGVIGAGMLLGRRKSA
jgi:hypothetical protein